MSLERVTGSFPLNASWIERASSVVIFDQGRATGPGWSFGAVRTSTPSVRQALAEKWTLLGWSLRCQALLTRGAVASSAVWGRVGDLWAGLGVDAAMQDADRASLPQDLSTFAKVFVGATDDVPVVQPTVPSLPVARSIGTSVMLPAPLAVSSLAQLQMALILTPSLTGGDVSFVVLSADYTILYESA